MTCWWAENPNGDEFRYHLGKVPDYLWIGEDGMTMNCFGSQAWDWSLSTQTIHSKELVYTNIEQFLEPLELCYRSLCACGDRAIADGSLLDFLRHVSIFGLSLVRLDIRQESDRHKRNVLYASLNIRKSGLTVNDVLDTFQVLEELPLDCFGAYIISMATSPSDVLAVELLQRECHVKKPFTVVPHLKTLRSSNQLQQPCPSFSISHRMTCGTVVRRRWPTILLYCLNHPTIHGSLRVTVQGEVIEQSFVEEHLCFRTLQRFCAATREHGMNPPISPQPKWRALMDEIAVHATEQYREIVFKEPRFVEYFRLATPELEYGRMNIRSRPSKRKNKLWNRITQSHSMDLRMDLNQIPSSGLA
ncbi:phosphoenolpyruvate carboxylase [Tanacetum coccineum]